MLNWYGLCQCINKHNITVHPHCSVFLCAEHLLSTILLCNFMTVVHHHSLLADHAAQKTRSISFNEHEVLLLYCLHMPLTRNLIISCSDKNHFFSTITQRYNVKLSIIERAHRILQTVVCAYHYYMYWCFS
jgi:hypothetical protein